MLEKGPNRKIVVGLALSVVGMCRRVSITWRHGRVASPRRAGIPREGRIPFIGKRGSTASFGTGNGE